MSFPSQCFKSKFFQLCDSLWFQTIRSFDVCISLEVFYVFSFLRTLRIFGPSDKRRELEPQLIWATPGQRGFSSGRSSRTATGRPNSLALPSPMPIPSQSQLASSKAATGAARKQQEALHKAAELRQMLNSLEKVDDESRRASLLDTLCGTDDVLSMPTHSMPPGISSGELTVDLLKHQA